MFLLGLWGRSTIEELLLLFLLLAVGLAPGVETLHVADLVGGQAGKGGG